MAANLTQQYHKAEQAYRQAETPQEELECLQTMLVELPKHKGTDKMHADLKTKIAAVKKEIASGKSSGPKGASHRIPKQGAGRVIIIGAPNAGKSQLLASMTRATPEIGDYPFTTRQPQPGMMPWEDVYVQLIDTPPITPDVFDPNTMGLIRGADLVLLVMDLGSDDGWDDCKAVIDKVNQTKTHLGNITGLDPNDIGVSVTRTLLVVNKTDLPEASDRYEVFKEFMDCDFESCEISAKTGDGIDRLRDSIREKLDFVRVYTKLPTKKEADMDKPFTVKQGSCLLDVAELVHKDVAANLKSARVWGSAVHDGTTVKGDYVLNDRDIVELHV